MNYIYLDNSATTRLSEKARAAMLEAMDKYGNPSSLHTVGLEANELLSSSRKAIAATFGTHMPKPAEIIFTGSGSEANNLAISGTAFAKKRRDADTVITTDSEHPSVENVMQKLESEGFRVVRISTKGGELDLDQLNAALENKILMVSMMMVNNETGALYDVKSAFSAVKRRYPDAVTHCDAVQGYMKNRFTPASIGADLVTVSSHKIHGPKGVGALYINPAIVKAKKISPIILGGGQESGYRSGTENIIGIAGFAAAAKEQYSKLDSDIEYLKNLRMTAEKEISKISEVRLNIPNGTRAPHILNITLPHIKSETMLHFLSSKGICVSSGSACSSRSSHRSQSLLAFGLTPDEADTSIRISFSEYNTEDDVSALARSLSEGVLKLVRIK